MTDDETSNHNNTPDISWTTLVFNFNSYLALRLLNFKYYLVLRLFNVILIIRMTRLGFIRRIVAQHDYVGGIR